MEESPLSIPGPDPTSPRRAEPGQVRRRLRVIFFGEPSSTFSRLHYQVLQQHRLVKVAAWIASPTGWRGGRRAAFLSPSDAMERLTLRLSLESQTLRHLGIPLAVINVRAPNVRISKIRSDDTLADDIMGLRPDLVVSAGFQQILPPAILEIPQLGAFNCHPSPLPRYAGSNPWFWILKGGEVESAVTIHRMVGEVDAGDIVAQRLFPIGERTNYQGFYNRSSLESALLLRECVGRWVTGTAREHPQDLTQRTIFSAPRERDYEIDWTETMMHIEALVRAAAPAPCALMRVRGQGVRIRRCEREPKIFGKPGTVVRMSPSDFVVACGDGSIRIARGAFSAAEAGGPRMAQDLGLSVGERISAETESLS